MKKIETSLAPKAVGPYSQAVVCGNLIFTSGQIALNPETGLVEGSDIVTQTKRVLENLTAVLKAAGATADKVVKTTCFLQDMADFEEFNTVYEKVFSHKPARSCVAVRALPKGVLVEVEAIAEI